MRLYELYTCETTTYYLSRSYCVLPYSLLARPVVLSFIDN